MGRSRAYIIAIARQHCEGNINGISLELTGAKSLSNCNVSPQILCLTAKTHDNDIRR